MEHINSDHSLLFARTAQGRMVCPSEVPQGLACECTCPSCDQAVICRKGNKRVHHFAHYSGAQCSTAGETAIHLMAKQIIAGARELNLPICKVSKSGVNRWSKTVEREKVVAQASNVGVRHSELEKRCGEFIPDVSLTLADGSSLFVEIRVTHGINEIKEIRLRHANTRCLEIRIKTNQQLSDIGAFQQIVLDQAPREWVFHPGVREAELAFDNWFKEEAIAREEIEKKNAKIVTIETPNKLSEAKSKPEGEPMDKAMVQWLYHEFCRLRESAGRELVGNFAEDKDQLTLIADIDLISRQLYRKNNNMSHFSEVPCFEMDLTHEEQMRRLMTPGGLCSVPVQLQDLYDVYQQLSMRNHVIT